MAAPILKLGDDLIASLQPGLTDSDLTHLGDEIAELVASSRTRGVILDVSRLEIVDSFAARTLRTIAGASRMRGAETVIVGIQPDVAVSMARLGVTFDNVATALDLEEGLAVLHGVRDGGVGV